MMPSEPSEPPKTDRKSIKAKDDAPPSSRKNSKSPGGSQAGKDKEKQRDNDNNNIEQEELRKMKKEIETLQDIEENKCTLRYHIKEEEVSGQDLSMFDIAMDLSHIQDNHNYTEFIQEKLPQLHDQIIPSSLREMAFLEPMLQASKPDWKIDGLERALELEQIEESMFYNQIRLHGMDHSFKKLIEELHLM